MSSSSPPNPLPPNHDIGPFFLALTCVLTAFSIGTTGLRLWVRRVAYQVGWDDYTILVTTLLAVIRMALQVVQVEHGNGRHRWYITPRQYRDNNMYGWYAQVLLFVTNALLKTSICLLILRIQNTKKLRYLLYGMMGGLWLVGLEPVLVLLAECDPVATYWRGSGGKCWDPRVRIYSIYFNIAYGIISDLTCSLLPIVILRKIKVSLKDKIAICGLMSIGLVATGFSVARAASLGLAVNDLSWTYCIAAIWSNLELHLGITAANLALARSWFVYFRKGARGINNPSQLSSSRLQPGSRRSGYIKSDAQGSGNHRLNFGVMSKDFEARGSRYYGNGLDGGARKSYADSGESEIPLHALSKEKSGTYVTEEVRSVSDEGEEMR
ncbi:MAG: hypothetical protein M1822_007825 [Bathelium mastoideum]|nr:MAG: hypothetical protein M1822_007825 [Bathelium mastoideum]